MTPQEYIKSLADVFVAYKDKLKRTGNLIINLGDVYFGTKGFSRNTGKYKRDWDGAYNAHKCPPGDGKYLQHKQLLLLPSRLAVALQDQGFILRNDIIWRKPNPMPVYSRDRKLPTYEHFLHFVVNKKYHYDESESKTSNHTKDIIDALPVRKYGTHKASYPEALIEPFVKIYSPVGGLVFDPFLGSGTTAVVAKRCGRNYGGCELSKEFFDETIKRLSDELVLT